MDRVDNSSPSYGSLNSLQLSKDEENLVRKLCIKFGLIDCKYFVLNRGLSSAIKLILKPIETFPLLIKIDHAHEIMMELNGDQIFRHRVPPLSIPPLVGTIFEKEKGLIAYRYVTGGRVRDAIKRFDTEFGNISTYTSLRIVDEIFDVILKKCHWLDEQYEMKPIELPELPFPKELKDDARWNELFKKYKKIKNELSHYRAPHAITHGDLHPKNILLSRNNSPILIDFAKVQLNQCQYNDFAKLETSLQFQCSKDLAEPYWRIQDLMYGPTELIVQRSTRKLATTISRIRANLWQGCMRSSIRMPYTEVEKGYRGFLFFHLARIYSRIGNSQDTRNRANDQALLVYDGLGF